MSELFVPGLLITGSKPGSVVLHSSGEEVVPAKPTSETGSEVSGSSRPSASLERDDEEGSQTALQQMTQVCNARSKQSDGGDHKSWVDTYSTILQSLVTQLPKLDVTNSCAYYLPSGCRRHFSERVDCRAIKTSLSRATPFESKFKAESRETVKSMLESMADLWLALNAGGDVASHPVLYAAKLGLQECLTAYLRRDSENYAKAELRKAEHDATRWVNQLPLAYGPEPGPEPPEDPNEDIHTVLKPVAAVVFTASSAMLLNRAIRYYSDRDDSA